MLINGECLEEMRKLPDSSVDMILCDLPYGTTACKWDVIIPFDKLWEQYNRIIKDNGAIVLTSTEPFTSKLIMSNIKCFKHKWIWNKKLSGNFGVAKFMPMQIVEDICVFSKNGNKVNYFPIMTKGKLRKRYLSKARKQVCTGMKGNGECYKISDKYYPKNIIEIGNTDRKNIIHPTQKPVALFEYLIKTYTYKGMSVLDNTCGSGTTAVACLNTERNFICIEKEQKYVKVAQQRIKDLLEIERFL